MTSLAHQLRFFALACTLFSVGCQDKKAGQAMTPPPTPPEVAPGKPKIAKLDDLPRHTYPVQGTVSELVTSDAKFTPFAASVRADVEKDLATYDIADKTTLRRLKGELLYLDLLDGRNADARQTITDLQGLETKPAAKLTTGLVTLARLDVMDKSGKTDLNDPAFQQAFQTELTKRASSLPWNVVRDVIKSMKASADTRSADLIMGVIQSEIEPAVAKTGSLSSDLAASVIQFRTSLLISIPLKKPMSAALAEVIKANNVEKADIWKNREFSFKGNEKLQPVVIGIWDSGVDPSVYPKLLFNDPDFSSTPAHDHNLHGLAFDLHSNRVTGDLYPLGDDSRRVPELQSQIKGMLDMQAAVDSPEAVAMRSKLSTLPANQVKPLLEGLGLYGNYMHGTHVAGIATKGNPFARILIARITFDYHLMPEKPTIAQAQKDAAAYQATVDYFKQHGVRVVNMSWGGSLRSVEEALEKNGEGDAEARKKDAREIFDIGKNGLYNAMKSAPEILFVTAAGNSDNDVNFDEVIPSSFDLPNLVTVGAVDQAGDETSFTSFGKNVTAYADGFQVESSIPGGSKLKLSGTSMASPEVTNLAAKLFTLNPTLHPGDVIDLIRKGVEPSASNPQILLINPAKSIGLLEANP